MESATLAGAVLQVFSPSVVCVLFWLWYSPQQILVSLVGALGCIVVVGVVGAVFVGATASDAAAAGFTYFQFVVQETVRLLLSLAVSKVEMAFRSKRQSLTASRMGVAVTGFALGIGQGTMHAVLTAGLGISLSSSASFNGVVGYSWSRCPVMPALQYASLAALLSIVMHAACGVITFLLVFSVVAQGGLESVPLAAGADMARGISTRRGLLLLAAIWALRVLFVSMPLANSNSYSIPTGYQSPGCEATLPVAGLVALVSAFLAAFGVYSDSC